MSMSMVNGCRPFILVPRHSSLDVLPKSGMSKIYDSLQFCLSLKGSSLARGRAKTIFGDEGVRVVYKCVGVRASINSHNVVDYNNWTTMLGVTHWRRIMKMVKRAEVLLEAYAPQEVLDHIRIAREVVPFKTMHAPHFNGAFKRIPAAKYFGAIAFGCNVFLRCHTDDDFTMSMAHILLRGVDVYRADDDVVVFFCFPTLGVAVPMKPGDFLIFNATIPHCISTRCHQADSIMCISMFLKTAVVGLNNNSIPLTNVQHQLADQYRDMMIRHDDK